MHIVQIGGSNSLQKNLITNTNTLKTNTITNTKIVFLKQILYQLLAQ